MRRLIINGDSVYEVDEDCLREKSKKKEEKKHTLNGQKSVRETHTTK